MNTCYSLNDEDFCLTDFGDVLDSLESDGRCEVGEVYYEADFRHIAPKDVVSVSFLIEDMDERLYEAVGEAADDGMNASKEAVAELEAYLLQWVEKHADIKRYFVIEGKSREKQITADDLTPNAKLGRNTAV